MSPFVNNITSSSSKSFNFFVTALIAKYICPYQFVAFFTTFRYYGNIYMMLWRSNFKFSIERNWFCNPYPRNRLKWIIEI
jgi:hypothetical protein